jgi:hypothetical protein
MPLNRTPAPGLKDKYILLMGMHPEDKAKTDTMPVLRRVHAFA